MPRRYGLSAMPRSRATSDIMGFWFDRFRAGLPVDGGAQDPALQGCDEDLGKIPLTFSAQSLLLLHNPAKAI